jgi:hypothetical protein
MVDCVFPNSNEINRFVELLPRGKKFQSIAQTIAESLFRTILIKI